jgi:hypothetical protein
MFFLLQETTPDTSPYLIAGYAVIFGVMLIYLVSLAIRRRNLKQDLEVLEDLERAGPGESAQEAFSPRAAQNDLASKGG